LIAAKIDTHLGALESLLSRLSTAVSTNPNDVDANDALLRRSKSGLPSFIANIILLSLDGKNIGNAVGNHASAGDRDYFQRVLAGEPFVVGKPIRSRSDLGWVCPVASPIKNSSGELQAVLVIATFLERFGEVLGVNELPPGSVVSITDGKGIAIASIPNAPELIGRDLNGLGNVNRHLRLKEGSEFVTWFDQVTRITGFSTTHRAPWLVTVGLPAEIGSAGIATRLKWSGL